jgi:hypothetical protein
MSVDALLDDLFDALAGTGRAGRRALAEAEDHLRTATAEGMARGLSEDQAEADAVRRFGEPRAIASAIRTAQLGIAGIARAAFVGAWLVGGLGLVALGPSGLTSEVLGRALGAGFVAGDASGVTYTPQRCADYFEYFPNAASCGDAAALHHWGEVVMNRVAAGVLGLLALLVLYVARRTVLRGPAWRLPSPYVASVLLAIFASVGALLTGVSVLSMAFGQTSGVGAGLADGAVSAIAALAVAGWLLRRLRRGRRLTNAAG